MTQSKFDELLARIPAIGLAHHKDTLLENTRRNAEIIKSEQSIRAIEPASAPCLVISAGPSLRRGRILERLKGFNGTIVAADGAYISCLRAGVKPDYVVTIDPHPTRIVRWFGDPANRTDAYFSRQDLAPMSENDSDLALVDQHRAPLIIACSAPRTVVYRTAGFERYWFAPLVDEIESGITKELIGMTWLPALNTGGTVGTAAWCFSHAVLQSQNIAVVGMDFGYPTGTPLERTQEFNLTGGDPAMYPQHGDYYTSPTYWWYRQNFIDLLEAADATVTNCSGAGLLDSERVIRMELEQWLKSCS